MADKPVSNISDLRRKAGLTQLQLSQRVGVTETTIANWEKNRGGGLELIERFVKLCDALGCEAKDLLSYPTQSVASVPQDASLATIREYLGTSEPVHFSSTEHSTDEKSTQDALIDRKEKQV